MVTRETLIQEYYEQQMNRMIDCPFQPGNLKISEKACQKRHKAAHKKKQENFKSEDLFHFFVSQGLIRCENCPIIQKTHVGKSQQSFTTTQNQRGSKPARGLTTRNWG